MADANSSPIGEGTAKRWRGIAGYGSLARFPSVTSPIGAAPPPPMGENLEPRPLLHKPLPNTVASATLLRVETTALAGKPGGPASPEPRSS